MTSSVMFALRRMGFILLYGIIGPLAIIAISLLVQMYRSHVDPLKNWFQPIHVHVPDHCAGDDPRIIYDRVISHEFDGAYHAQYINVRVDNSLGFPVCEFQSEVLRYYPKTELRVTPRLSEFMGRSCVLLSGKYRVEVTWVPRRPSYLEETPSLVSNVFEIRPSTDKACEGVHE